MIPPLSLSVLSAPARFRFADFEFAIQRATLADWVVSRRVEDDLVFIALIDGHTDGASWLVWPTNNMAGSRSLNTWAEASNYAVALPVP